MKVQPTETMVNQHVTIDISNNIIKKDNKKSATICAIITIVCLLLPFIFCDYYYAFNNDSCQHINVDKLSLNISKWLIVIASVSVFSIIIAILVIIFGLETNSIYKLLGNIINLFNTAWLIIGSILFWKYIDPLNVCNSDINGYMWARLIITIVFNIKNIKDNNQKKK